MTDTLYGISLHNLILLIDNNQIDNFVNQTIIEELNFSKKITIFTKASEALEYLSDVDEKQNDSELPSLIFLNLNMPLINGFQFLELFDKLSSFARSKTKIIILNSSSNANDIILSKKNKNVIAFLQKPLSKSNLNELDIIMKKNLQLIAK
ncbi:MAG: response regulator [Bacteroidia bacterium]